MLIKKIVELTKIWKCLQLLDLNVTSLNVISLVLEISGRCYMLYYCQYSIWRIIIIINPFKDPSFIVIDWSLLSTIIITTITIYYYYHHHHRHRHRHHHHHPRCAVIVKVVGVVTGSPQSRIVPLFKEVDLVFSKRQTEVGDVEQSNRKRNVTAANLTGRPIPKILRWELFDVI